MQLVRIPAEPCSLGAAAGPPAFDRHWRHGWRRDAPHQLRVEATPSSSGAAAQELGSGAEPGTCGLADGLGLGEGLVARALPPRIRLPPHRAARPKAGPAWGLDVGAAPHLWPRIGVAVSIDSARNVREEALQARTSCSSFGSRRPAASEQRPSCPHSTRPYGGVEGAGVVMAPAEFSMHNAASILSRTVLTLILGAPPPRRCGRLSCRSE